MEHHSRQHLARRPATAATAATPRRRRVLVADDHLPGLLLAEAALQFYQCDVVPVGDGQSAWEALQREQFDIVFLDVHMPELTGIQIASRLRTREAPAGSVHTPVIALTATALPADLQRCREAGMDDVLLKPFRLDELKAVLDKWCPTDVLRSGYEQPED